MIAFKCNNAYTININDICDETYFLTLNDDSWLWYRRLGHASMKLISQILTENL